MPECSLGSSDITVFYCRASWECGPCGKERKQAQQMDLVLQRKQAQQMDLVLQRKQAQQMDLVLQRKQAQQMDLVLQRKQAQQGFVMDLVLNKARLPSPAERVCKLGGPSMSGRRLQCGHAGCVVTPLNPPDAVCSAEVTCCPPVRVALTQWSPPSERGLGLVSPTRPPPHTPVWSGHKSRNELIARYIKLRTGKTRTRKQVSSHIQVLARRKSREFHTKLKDQSVKDKALQSMASMSSAQIVSATAIHNKLGLPRPTFPGATGGMISTGQPGSSQDIKPFSQQAYPIQTAVTTTISAYEPPTPTAPAWQGRSIGTTKLRLVEFSAFLEQQRDPDSYLFVNIGQTNYSYSDALLEAVDIRQIYDKFPEKKGGLKELFGKGPHNSFFLVKFWADLNCNIQEDSGAFYGTEYACFENGRFVYRISRSPMCEYMINFIHKLKHLPEKYMMNSVLENFTILLVMTNRETQETLLCMACVFEVSNSEHGAQHHIYRLVKE
ncbi:unnamed protein product [Coregonus sp. 'balchen']|nr:unnamed protein product [Coregonus sp. 'balchen']